MYEILLLNNFLSNTVNFSLYFQNSYLMGDRDCIYNNILLDETYKKFHLPSSNRVYIVDEWV